MRGAFCLMLCGLSWMALAMSDQYENFYEKLPYPFLLKKLKPQLTWCAEKRVFFEQDFCVLYPVAGKILLKVRQGDLENITAQDWRDLDLEYDSLKAVLKAGPFYAWKSIAFEDNQYWLKFFVTWYVLAASLAISFGLRGGDDHFFMLVSFPFNAFAVPSLFGLIGAHFAPTRQLNYDRAYNELYYSIMNYLKGYSSTSN